MTYEQLAGGGEDSQFVEISGIVRSVELHDPSKYYLIEIATGGDRLSVYSRTLPCEHGRATLEDLFITVAREPLALEQA